MKSIYKSPESKQRVLELYDLKAQSLDFPYREIDVDTSFGKTRVIVSGNENGKKLVLFHGVHAGSPLTLESVKSLQAHYKIFAIDTIGQATKSAETTIDIKDDSFARWADEVLDQLSVEKANFVGVSYGAYILQKLITHKPHRVEKCILVVPSGLANGDFWPSLTKLTLPLLRFHLTQKDGDLRKFIRHFVPEDDEYMFQFQKAILQGVHLDYRRPSILQKQDVAHFKNPVFIMAAENDVFFPASKTIKQAEKVFQNLQEVYILKGCKHMPHHAQFAEIEHKIKEWIA
ncbi:MAG: alpha/beta hydrolase [Bacteroidota bacterium]